MERDYKREARESIQKLAGVYKDDRLRYVFAEVVSVDTDANTCVVMPIGNTVSSEIPNVQLQADVSDGVEIIPSVGSTVIVMWSLYNKPYVAMFSEVERIGINANDVVELQDGSFGGLTKTQELKTQLDKLNEQLQAVISSLTNWTPVNFDGGAALKVYFASAIAGKTEADFSNIENEKVTHGI